MIRQEQGLEESTEVGEWSGIVDEEGGLAKADRALRSTAIEPLRE